MFKKGRTWFYDSVEEALNHAENLGYKQGRLYKDHSGEVVGNFEIICPVGRKDGKHTGYVCRCLLCNSGKYIIKKSSSLHRDVSCGCISIESENIKKKLEDFGYIVLGFGDGTTKSKWKVKCKEGHVRNIWPSSAIHAKTGCKVCAVRKYKTTPEELEERIKLIDSEYVFIGLEKQFKGVQTKIIRQCNICFNNFSQTYNNIINHNSGCPNCNPTGFKKNTPSYFYIQHLLTKNRDILKFGVTNRNPDIRMKQQNSKSMFEHKLIYSVYLNSGQQALDLESIIKNKISTGVVSRESLPDGYTETCEFNNLGIILKTINETLPFNKGEFY